MFTGVAVGLATSVGMVAHHFAMEQAHAAQQENLSLKHELQVERDLAVSREQVQRDSEKKQANFNKMITKSARDMATRDILYGGASEEAASRGLGLPVEIGIILVDVNHDGRLDGKDCVAMESLGIRNDINKDGVTDAADAAIVCFLVGSKRVPAKPTANSPPETPVSSSDVTPLEIDEALVGRMDSGPFISAVASIRGKNEERVGVNFTLFGGPPGSVGTPTKSRKTKLFVACITAQTDRAMKQRSKIRQTWLGQIKKEYTFEEMDAFFFIGRADRSCKGCKDRPEVDPAVLEEQRTFGDLIIVDCPDTYAGLINKVRTVVQWILNDRSVEYVAKFDDDCYVNVPALLADISKYPPERLYYGNMMSGGKVLRTTRNGEPNLPRSMDWYPPYASGAGYVLSQDLVHAVAFPAVQLVDMVNEDAHLGILMLPFDVERVSTKKIHAHGVSVCTPVEQVIAVHYVKDKSQFDCMMDIHTNVTKGEPICKSRYCGPAVCDDQHPRQHEACKVDKKSLKWETIAEGSTCESNSENIERFAVGRHMTDLKCCKQRCEERCDCVAIDYYFGTMWCNLYTKACKLPHKRCAACSSYSMVRGRLGK
jgi:hypothetical protein